MKQRKYKLLLSFAIALCASAGHSQESRQTAAEPPGAAVTANRFRISAWKTDLPFRKDGIVDAQDARNIIVRRGATTLISGREKGLAIKGTNVTYYVFGDNLAKEDTKAREINEAKDYAVCVRVLDKDGKPLTAFADNLDLLDSAARPLDIACIIRTNGDRIFVLPKTLEINSLLLKIVRRGEDNKPVSIQLSPQEPQS